MTKECPLCNEMMRIHAVVHTTRIPGTQQQVSREGREWRCPECDYFEEVDDEKIARSESSS